VDWPFGLSAIRAPTLVCSGARDFIWPPASGQEVAALIPNAKFATLIEAGHFPHLQTPEALAELALDFLGSSGARVY
jgi:3-oxoadipate enol-lactonase